jgi:hypothetical protein
MLFELNDDNFEPYAMKHYRNDHCITIDEFYNDLKRIRYIRLLITRYKDSGDLRERLILNHLIALGNMFDVEAVVRMLFFRCEEEHYPVIKSFLSYLSFMPKVVYNINGHNIWSSEIKEDSHVLNKLKSI